KVLRQRDSADLMRFVRATGASFDHPHLLTPYGWGAEDEHVVIAMPLASGGTPESAAQTSGSPAAPAGVVILDPLLHRLSHLHAPYGWGAEDEHVVIAMPLVSGGTLESVVKTRGRLAEPAVVVILDQLLDGLSHVHAEGWIHRDVKPANIMFEPRGTAFPASRLADF